MKFPLLFAVVLGTLVSACGGSSTSPAPTTPSAATTTFQGTIAGSTGQTGTLDVTVQTVVASAFPFFSFPLVATLHAQTGTIAATGSLHLVGSSTTSLTGTYDSSTTTMNL